MTIEKEEEAPSGLMRVGAAAAEAGVGVNSTTFPTRDEGASEVSEETLAHPPDVEMEQRSRMQTAVIMGALCVRSNRRGGLHRVAHGKLMVCASSRWPCYLQLLTRYVLSGFAHR